MVNAQQNLPYSEISDTPDSYTEGTVLARYMDGLGYRYYWTTEGLLEKDLEYRPTSESRNLFQTMEHIYSLLLVIQNTLNSEPNIRPEPSPEMSYNELRAASLKIIERSSNLLRQAGDLEEYSVVFQSEDQTGSLPFWNLINGPMADAVYHTGQIASFRRSSGNPMNPAVNVFTGKNNR